MLEKILYIMPLWKGKKDMSVSLSSCRVVLGFFLVFLSSGISRAVHNVLA